jgi:L-iditol 2-dehydrogenase/L-idonate 5-dehydrogenase
MRYLGSAAHSPHTDGGFASEIVVRASNLRALPPSISLERFAMTEPASVAWHAISRVTTIAGARVLVIGAGPIGLALVAVLRLFTPSHITVVDLHERPLAIARSLGADTTVSAGSAHLIDPDTVDVTFECSGSAAGMEQAITTTRGGGEVVLVGNQNSGLIPFPAATTISSELSVKGSYRFNQEFDDVIAAIATGRLDLSAIVTATFEITEFESAFELAANSEESSKVLLSFPPDP